MCREELSERLQPNPITDGLTSSRDLRQKICSQAPAEDTTHTSSSLCALFTLLLRILIKYSVGGELCMRINLSNLT